ncbi:hypothetical protein V1524DRAFT_88647 [Lipomyces starkeyi]
MSLETQKPSRFLPGCLQLERTMTCASEVALIVLRYNGLNLYCYMLQHRRRCGRRKAFLFHGNARRRCTRRHTLNSPRSSTYPIVATLGLSTFVDGMESAPNPVPNSMAAVRSTLPPSVSSEYGLSPQLLQRIPDDAHRSLFRWTCWQRLSFSFCSTVCRSFYWIFGQRFHQSIHGLEVDILCVDYDLIWRYARPDHHLRA